jgi:tripartite-type tricarboxylate transporter receptor subunit TctC
MALHRRRFLEMAGAAAAVPLARPALAQAYPTRPVKVVVGYAPGGPTDIAARLIGQWLSDRLGQQFVIENRPGATGNIGTEVVVNAPPDGYTLLVAATSAAINTTLFQKLSFAFHRDTAPVGAIIRVPNVLEVTPSFPARTVPEFIAFAKANPGKINFASGGNGTSQHVSGELFKMMAGVDMLHVPYRGSAPALTDLIAGHVQVMFDAVSSSISYIRGGQARALAVTTATRLNTLPDLPTVGDFVPGYEASAWFGVCAPKDTPADIIETLNREINAGLADAGMKARLADLGGTPLPGSPAEFGKLILAETEKWAKVVKFSGARAD